MYRKAGLLACAAVVLFASGCEKKVGGQVVAVVNGQEITQQELNAELNGAQLPPNADKKAIMAQVLQRVIDRKLLVEKAKAQGLDKTPVYLAQVSRAQDGILIETLASNIAKSVAVPDAAAADKFMAGTPSMFAGRKRYQLDQIVFQPPNDPALAAKLDKAKTMPEVEAALTASKVQFQRGQGQLDTATIAPAIAARIAQLAPGEPFLVPQQGRVVASVIRSAEAVPMNEQQAKPAAIELLRRQSVDQALRKEIETARKAAKIDYEAGFAPPKATPTPAA